MRGHVGRLRRLEAAHRTRPPFIHHRMVVTYPWDCDDVPTWVSSQPCACGVVGCPERSVGVLLPDKAPSPEAWAAQVRADQRERDDHA